MQQKTNHKSQKPHIRKILLIVLAIVVIILAISLFKILWMNYNNQHTLLQQKLQHLENKIALMYQNLHNDQGYTIAQAQESYNIAKVASKVLQQDRDVDTAKSLLVLAQDHLANLHGDNIVAARTALTADISLLDKTQISDTSAIESKLDSLDQLLAAISIKDDVTESQFVAPTTPAATPENKATATNKWQQSWSNVVTDLKSVVKVRKKTTVESGNENGSKDLKQARFRLLVEEIRWAVFYKDAAVYQRSVANAQALLPQVFDPKNANVIKMQTILTELSQIQLKTDVPSIQNSLNALQAIIVR